MLLGLGSRGTVRMIADAIDNWLEKHIVIRGLVTCMWLIAFFGGIFFGIGFLIWLTPPDQPRRECIITTQGHTVCGVVPNYN
jgi:hypothetical protein